MKSGIMETNNYHSVPAKDKLFSNLVSDKIQVQKSVCNNPKSMFSRINFRDLARNAKKCFTFLPLMNPKTLLKNLSKTICLV